MPHKSIPLCVDLDGTLVKTDVLLEVIISAVKKRDARLLALPLWLWRGLPAAKRKIAELAPLDPALLPYDQEIVEYLKAERAAGRQLILATASDELIAKKVARHLGIFNQVFASDGINNLSARHKAERLVKEFGDQGFDYIGNERRDVAVWRKSRQALVARPTKVTLAAARRVSKVVKVFGGASNRLASWLAALRPYQWVKNILIFMPLLMAHELGDPSKLRQTLVAFVAFSLGASTFYLLNDLFDMPADRLHPTKRRRPLAAGDISITTAIVSMPILLLLSLALAYFVGTNFLLALLAYLVATCCYSWYLKERLLIDVVMLALLYVTRVVAGALAAAVAISFWFLAFALFIFFSLALIKRVAELRLLAARHQERARGRAYTTSDSELLISLASASGCVSVLVLALYIHSAEVATLYHRAYLLWLICPVLFYWISRALLFADRGQMSDDPIIFATRDRVSYIAGAIVLGLLLAAA